MSGFDLDASVDATMAMRPVRDPGAECYAFTTRAGGIRNLLTIGES